MVVKNNKIKKETIIKGRKKIINCLSPRPNEFITIASEFLYSCVTAKMIAKKSDKENINGKSLVIL